MRKKGSLEDLYIDEITTLQQSRRTWNRKKQIQLDLVEDLSTYPVYAQSIQTLTNFIKSREYILTGEESDPFYGIVNDSLNNMDLITVVGDFMEFLTYGNKFFEVVYKVNKDNMIVVDHLSPIPNRYMTAGYQNLGFDEQGNITSIHLGYNDITYNYPKFIYATYNSRNRDVFGNPILTKDLGDTIYMARENKVNRQIFNYKHSNPTVWQRINNPEHKNRVLKILSKIGDGLSNLTIGKDEEVGLLESKHTGNSFKSTIDDCNQEIALSLFIGNLLYGQGRTGSYSQSETHITMLYNNLNGLINEFDKFINTLIGYLWDLNYDSEDKPPVKFTMNKFRKNDYSNVFSMLKESPLSITDEDGAWFKKLVKVMLDEELNYDVDEDELIIKSGDSV
jgi:hypothetical protein